MLRCALAAALVALLPACPAQAGVHRITTGMDHMQIQDVMDRAVYGDSVLVEPGQYMMLIVRNGISLIGEEGPENTIFRHGGVVLTANEADSTTVIQGVTVDGVKASEGVIVAERSHVRIRDCILKNGWVGVRCVESGVIVEGCTISNCQNGIYLFESGGAVAGNEIRKCITGINLINSSPRIQRNRIFQNSLGMSIADHSDPSVGGSLATANRVYDNAGGAIKSTALVKRGGLRTQRSKTLDFPYNYWGTDCPDSVEIFRGAVEYRPWVDESGKRSLAACEASDSE